MLMRPCIGLGCYQVDDLAQVLMKGMTSYDILWRAACGRWTRGAWIGLPINSETKGNPGNWNVLVPGGKEINWDAVSKSDRTQHKANWIFCSNIEEMWCLDSLLIILYYLKLLGTAYSRGWQSRKKIKEWRESIQSIVYRILNKNPGGINFQP